MRDISRMACHPTRVRRLTWPCVVQQRGRSWHGTRFVLSKRKIAPSRYFTSRFIGSNKQPITRQHVRHVNEVTATCWSTGIFTVGSTGERKYPVSCNHVEENAWLISGVKGQNRRISSLATVTQIPACCYQSQPIPIIHCHVFQRKADLLTHCLALHIVKRVCVCRFVCVCLTLILPSWSETESSLAELRLPVCSRRQK